MSQFHISEATTFINKLKIASTLSASLMCISTVAHATVIDFEGLPTGAVANPLALSGASFTTPGGFNFITPFGSKSLCPSVSASSADDCSSNLNVTFSAAASNVSFAFAANNQTTIGADIGDVQVFSGVTLLGTVNVIVQDRSSFTYDVVNLAAFTGVTGLVITTTDASGLVYDNFSFTSVVPEPSTLALFGLGLAGIGFSRRRSLN